MRVDEQGSMKKTTVDSTARRVIKDLEHLVGVLAHAGNPPICVIGSYDIDPDKRSPTITLWAEPAESDNWNEVVLGRIKFSDFIEKLFDGKDTDMKRLGLWEKALKSALVQIQDMRSEAS